MQGKNQSLFKKFQPLLFCLGMYLLALSFSIGVCVSVFYAIQPDKTEAAQEQLAQVERTSDRR